MRRVVLLAAMAIMIVPGSVLLPAHGAANLQVVAGHDLFQTNPSGTHYGPVHFEGVKGCALVPQARNTDTIVQRKQTATRARPTIEIQARCLQLHGAFVDTDFRSPVFSVTPDGLVRVGPATLPVDQIYVTLQTDRGRHPEDALREAVSPGKASLGTLDFSFGRSGCGGTFDSTLKVYFDVRAGSINGPIVYSTDQFTAPMFYSYDTPWGCSARFGEGGFQDRARALVDSAGVAQIDCDVTICTDEHEVITPVDLLPGVNYLMNGRTRAGDFFPMEPR